MFCPCFVADDVRMLAMRWDSSASSVYHQPIERKSILYPDMEYCFPMPDTNPSNNHS
jgi:hypothetical protein